MEFLVQSTAVDVALGPFVDSTDGDTAKTALTLTQPDIRLKKNGGAWGQKSAAQTLTHEEVGWYEVNLSTTDTNTLGILIISVHETGALIVWKEFFVVTAAAYAFLTTGILPDNSISATSVSDAAYTALGENVGGSVWDSFPTDHDIATTFGGDWDLLMPSIATILAAASAGVPLSAAAIDAILDEPIPEAGVPSWPVTLRTSMAWLVALARNKALQTATQSTIRNDADSGNLGTSTVSDDGTTFTRGEYS